MPEKEKQSWSLVIPAFNEQNSIQKAVSEAADFLDFLPEDKREVIVIDDGSTDRTAEKAKSAQAQMPFLKVHSHKANKGIGQALQTGYRLAKKENLCAVPSDGQFDLRELRAFREIPPKTIISFYRVNYHYSPFRMFLTNLNRWLNRIFLGLKVRDINWIKIYKKSEIERLPPLVSKSSYVESEIVYCLRRKGHKIIQSPSQCLPREHGSSKSANYRIFKQVFKDILAILIKYRGARAPLE